MASDDAGRVGRVTIQSHCVTFCDNSITPLSICRVTHIHVSCVTQVYANTTAETHRKYTNRPDTLWARCVTQLVVTHTVCLIVSADDADDDDEDDLADTVGNHLLRFCL